MTKRCSVLWTPDSWTPCEPPDPPAWEQVGSCVLIALCVIAGVWFVGFMP